MHIHKCIGACVLLGIICVYDGWYIILSLHRGHCLHERIVKKPRVDVVEYVHQVEVVIDMYLDNAPNSCLRLGESQSFLLLLTLQGDLKMHY